MEKNSTKLKDLSEARNSHYDNIPKINYFPHLITIFILSVILGLAMFRSRPFATLHAYIIPAIGVLFLFAKSPAPSIYILSYIVSSHVLWRMTKAHVLWEYSKYVSIILAIFIILRYSKRLKNFILPFLFLFFISLSIPLTVNYYSNFSTVRRALSFNLSGPVVFALSVILFSNIKLKKKHLGFNMLMLLSPIISVGTISLSSILTHKIVYTTSSNTLASGGFGPNQVSAVLGLGALLGLLFGINYIDDIKSRLLIFSISIWLFIQSILTFSRGGPLNFILSTLVLFWYLIRDRKTRIRVISAISAILIAFILLLPKLEKLTQGKLEERFSNLNPTGRGQIALAELKLFKSHPLFGVGPGVGIAERSSIIGYFIASHTEYTRLLAEHGFWGLLALSILLYLFYLPIKRSESYNQKSFNAALLVWSLLEMAHSATRIAITTYLPGLTYIQIEEDNEE